MKKNMVLGLCLASLACVPVTAKAAFEWRGMPSTSSANESTTDSFPAPIGADAMTAVPVAPVEQILNIEDVTLNQTPPSGTPLQASGSSNVPGAYHGFGTDIPLSLAVKQIVPPNLTVSFEGDIDQNRPVSWRGDGYWSTTLASILQSEGLTHDVVENRVEIRPMSDMATTPTPAPVLTLSQNPAPAPATSVSQDTIRWSGPPVADAPVRNVQTSRADAAPVPLYAEQTVGMQTATPVPMRSREMPRQTNDMRQMRWMAAPNDTLRQTIERWGQANGTEVIWTIDYDYRLKQEFSASGSFEEAVESLLDGFKKVEPRPYGALMRNARGGRTLVIRAYGIN